MAQADRPMEMADVDEAQLVGLGLMACGAALIIRWDRAHEPSPPQASRDPKAEEKKRWDREYEPSPPRMSRDPEPGMEEKESKFRAQNEPTWTKSQESFKSGRENEPPPSPTPNTSYRCHLGTPPEALPQCCSMYGTSPPCSHGSGESVASGDRPWWSTPPRNENERKRWAEEGWWWNGRTWCTAVESWEEEEQQPMVRMMHVKPPPPETVLHPPWLDPQFQRAPIGSKDSWMSLCGWLCRVHRKPRTQLCHPLHSTCPCGPDVDLTGNRTTIFFREDDPREPYQLSDDWTVSPTREGRDAMRQLGKWRGFTFFELRNRLVPRPKTEPSQGWHGTAWLAPETGGTWRSDWETIMKFNRQQAALGRPQIPVGKLNQMQPPVVPRLPMAKVQQEAQSPSSTRVEVGRALVEVGPNEEIYPEEARASEWALQQQEMRRVAQPDSEPSSLTISSGTGTLQTSSGQHSSLDSKSSGKQTMQAAPQQSACAGIAPTGFVPPKGWAYYERNEPASSSMCNPRGPPVKAPPQGATSVRSVPAGKMPVPLVKAPPKVGDSLQSVPMGRLLVKTPPPSASSTERSVGYRRGGPLARAAAAMQPRVLDDSSDDDEFELVG